MFQVLAFYKNLGIKVRVTEYSTEGEALEYIPGSPGMVAPTTAELAVLVPIRSRSKKSG